MLRERLRHDTGTNMASSDGCPMAANLLHSSVIILCAPEMYAYMSIWPSETGNHHPLMASCATVTHQMQIGVIST
jgi:hypothetical protein